MNTTSRLVATGMAVGLLSGCTFGHYRDADASLTFVSLLPGKSESAFSATLEGKGEVLIQRNQDSETVINNAVDALAGGAALLP